MCHTGNKRTAAFMNRTRHSQRIERGCDAWVILRFISAGLSSAPTMTRGKAHHAQRTVMCPASPKRSSRLSPYPRIVRDLRHSYSRVDSPSHAKKNQASALAHLGSYTGGSAVWSFRLGITSRESDCFAKVDSRCSSALRVDGVHQIHHLTERRDFLTKAISHRRDPQPRDTHVLVRPDALAHHLGGAEEIRLNHHL